MTSGDIDATRGRLLEAAGDVFAKHGFEGTTVREICTRAGANVAAVNYHFRDKMGLYHAVLKESLCIAAVEPGQSKSPVEALGILITVMLRRMSEGSQRGAWHVRIMAHELARPTAGLDQVIEQVIGPNYVLLRRILGEITGLPPDHETTRFCAHSVMGQVVHYAHARPVIARLWPELTMTEGRVEQIAQHITSFSVAGLRDIARSLKIQAKKRAGKTETSRS